MSKRIARTALVLTLFAVNANADESALAIGETGWEVFKPSSREATIFDLNYLTEDLIPDADPIGFRFKRFDDITISIEIDPLSRRSKMIGPVTDMGVGAAMLSFAFQF